MNDPILKDLLNYHQPLNDAEFGRQLMHRIKAAERKRRMIMWFFSVVGLILSTVYLVSVSSVISLTSLMTPINGLLLFSIGLFVVWLWTDPLASG